VVIEISRVSDADNAHRSRVVSKLPQFSRPLAGVCLCQRPFVAPAEQSSLEDKARGSFVQTGVLLTSFLPVGSLMSSGRDRSLLRFSGEGTLQEVMGQEAWAITQVSVDEAHVHAQALPRGGLPRGWGGGGEGAAALSARRCPLPGAPGRRPPSPWEPGPPERRLRPGIRVLQGAQTDFKTLQLSGSCQDYRAILAVIKRFLCEGGERAFPRRPERASDPRACRRLDKHRSLLGVCPTDGRMHRLCGDIDVAACGAPQARPVPQNRSARPGAASRRPTDRPPRTWLLQLKQSTGAAGL
ncbi:unnamed protein product, partial [Rangifer tarandus platyrhynchus]